MTALNWGILGTGAAASSMSEALSLVPGARCQAVASRSQQKAEAFAARHGVPAAHGSYDAFFDDRGIDIVYIATPNAQHKDHILQALAAGKHVLCEKPLTLSFADSAACFAAAEAAGLQLMEALWTAFLPAFEKAVALVRGGEFGVPTLLEARFVSFRDKERYPHLFDPALGGGARYDLGIYPIAAALKCAGPVQSLVFDGVTGDTGVDEMVAVSATHANGALSQLAFGFRAELPVTLRVAGECGYVEIAERFHAARSLRLVQDGRETVFDLPPLGMGYAHEAIAFQALVTGDCAENTVWSQTETLATAQLLEQITV